MKPLNSASAIPSPFPPSTAKALSNCATRWPKCCRARASIQNEPEDAPSDEFVAFEGKQGDEDDGVEADETKPLRIAVLGRPNAGKSTLLNRILGQDRLLTGPEAGLTRDSISVETVWRGRELKLFDTAGLRRKARQTEKLEKLAAADGLRAVRFAEVVILLLDATIPFEKQDLTLADLVEREGRALVIAINKWDLVDNKSDRARELREEADRLLPQLRGTRVVPVSGLHGLHIDRLLEAVAETHKIWDTRISTGRLNRWLAPVIEFHAAAGGLRPARENPLHDAAEGASAVLRAVRQPGREHSRRLQTLPRERLARDFRADRGADPLVDALHQGKPLRAEGQEELARPHLSVAVHAIFKRAELLDANRPARMHASRRNADLRAEAELAAVGELGRGVVQHNGAVDFL